VFERGTNRLAQDGTSFDIGFLGLEGVGGHRSTCNSEYRYGSDDLRYRQMKLRFYRSWRAPGTGDSRQTTRKGGMRVDELPQGRPSGFMQNRKQTAFLASTSPSV
jgi:hypothetical protein